MSILTTLSKFVVAASVAAALTGPAAAAEKVTFSVLGGSGSLPFWVALEEGLFTAEGIEAEYNVFNAPNQVIDSFITRRSEVGPGSAAGITLVANSQFPGTLKIYALTGGREEPFVRGNALVVDKDSDITSFEDLKGKSVGTLPGIQWLSITRHIFKAVGMNPETDVKIVELALPLQVQALLAGSVDALLVTEPNVSLALATGEVKVAMENPADKYVGSPFFSGAGVVSGEFYEKRPEIARKVIRIMIKATEMTDANYEHYRPLLAKYGGMNPETLVNIPLGYSVSQDKLTEAELDGYQKFADMFYEEGAMETPINVREQFVPLADIMAEGQ